MVGPSGISNFNSPLRHLNQKNNTINKIDEQLSSGSKIPNFAYDAAGGAISEKLRALFLQYEREINNEADTYNRLNTQEGAYSAIGDNLQRIRELQVSYKNDTLTEEDREHIQFEVDLLAQTIGNISEQAEFNTKKVVEPGQELQNVIDNGVDAGGEFVDKIIEEVSTERSNAGAQMNNIEKEIDGKMIAYENTVASYSTIADMDFAKGLVERANQEVMQQAGIGNIKNMFNISKQNVLNLLG
ncbi:MAG: flagellin [Candidatus Muiribacteriota bacterium]